MTRPLSRDRCRPNEVTGKSFCNDSVAAGNYGENPASIPEPDTPMNAITTLIRKTSRTLLLLGMITALISPPLVHESVAADSKIIKKLKKQNKSLKRQLAIARRPVPLPTELVEMVEVGDPGNPADVVDGDANIAGTQLYGSVPYEFRIGKYEVTWAQYTLFLNSIARSDTYGVYKADMTTNQNSGGVQRSGAPENYTYSTFNDPNRPVAFVTWFDAARFCNWLHNGRPTGSQTNATTETGAYPLYGATTGGNFQRVPGARYWIPNDNEWYKAAYYQPSAFGGDSDNYWTYPTGSNTLPGNLVGGAPQSNHANYRLGSNLFSVTQNATVVPTTVYTTPGGSYGGTPGYFGTFDMAGNVSEWIEANPSPANRATRGGSWASYGSALRFESRTETAPTSSSQTTGFRIAAP